MSPTKLYVRGDLIGPSPSLAALRRHERELPRSEENLLMHAVLEVGQTSC